MERRHRDNNPPRREDGPERRPHRREFNDDNRKNRDFDDRPRRNEESRGRYKRDDRPRMRHNTKQITKMFISKEEVVEYVNKIGDEGHHIDVFKIEEGLYKVVAVTPHYLTRLDK